MSPGAEAALRKTLTFVGSVVVHIGIFALLLLAVPTFPQFEDYAKTAEVIVLVSPPETAVVQDKTAEVNIVTPDRPVPKVRRSSRVAPYQPLILGRRMTFGADSDCDSMEKILDKLGRCDVSAGGSEAALAMKRQPLLKDDVETEITARAEQEGLVKRVPRVPWYKHEDIVP